MMNAVFALFWELLMIYYLFVVVYLYLYSVHSLTSFTRCRQDDLSSIMIVFVLFYANFATLSGVFIF